MNMKKLILFLYILTSSVLSTFAQTPYDNFAPEQSVKPMIELPQAQFRVANTDIDSEIRYVEFNKNTLFFNLLDNSENVIISFALNPKDKKFTTIDPLAEKYYSISPYAYCANNPIKHIDLRGDSISVAEEHRESFNNSLNSVFGDYSQNFGYTSTGMLTYNGSKKGMSKDQKQAFKGLNRAMNDKQTTSVVYANTYDMTVGGEVRSVDIVQEFGGGLYSKLDNLIVIAPNVGTVEVNLTLEDWQATGKPTQNVQQNTISTLFHEIGERNTTNTHFRGAVIDYENSTRRVIGLPKRPYDLYHRK